MSSVHQGDLDEQVAFACAQAGCQACMGQLLRRHQGLVHVVLRRQCAGDLDYADMLQEGQIGLWQAIRHYDAGRGVAFSTYAGVAIARHIWQAVAREQRPHGWREPVEPPDPAAVVEVAWQRRAVRAALADMLSGLPTRLCRVVVAAYGLDGQPPLSLAAIGRLYGVSRERVRQWRNDALLRLRLPAVSALLRRWCAQDSRSAYQQALALNRAWQRRRRGGGR